MAGVSPKLQDAVFEPEASSPSAGSGVGGSNNGGATSKLSPQEEQIASQYRKMMKVGMPEGAVRQKMAADGVSAKIQDSVIAGDSAGAPSTSPSPTSASIGGDSGGPVSSLSPEDEAVATQYRKMMKIKMPQGAIMQKMAIAGVPQHIQDSVLKGEIPASEPAPTSSASMPVNPLAAMIASSGGIGSLKASAPVDKIENPSGKPGNPLAAAIAASGGISSLKKAAPGATPVKSSSDAGGLLGELSASGFKGSLKRAAVKERTPPKPSSSGGLLGELTASGFKGSLKKSSDQRVPPKQTSSGGLLGELSASGFKGSLKKSPPNRVPPMKSASTGNTDFNKLLEERRKRAEAAAATGSSPPRNKLPPSETPPVGQVGHPSAHKEKVPPKKTASTGSSGFSKLFPGRKDKNSSEETTPKTVSVQSKQEQPVRQQAPPLPPSVAKRVSPSKAIEKEQSPPKTKPVKPIPKALATSVETKTLMSEAASTQQLNSIERVPDPIEALETETTREATKQDMGTAHPPKSPLKLANGAASHIASMLSRRQQEKARSNPASPVKEEIMSIDKSVTMTPKLTLKDTSPEPMKSLAVKTESQVPLAVAAISKQSRAPLIEYAVPSTFMTATQSDEPKTAVESIPTKQPVQMEAIPAQPKDSLNVAPVTQLPLATVRATDLKPTSVAMKAPVPATQSPAVALSAPDPRVSPTSIANKESAHHKVAQIPQSEAAASKPAAVPLVAKPTPPTGFANGIPSASKAPPTPNTPEEKPEPKIQVKTEEKVTHLANGKEVLDVATTTVKADGTHARERKRKTKNSDKKPPPSHDDGVDHHCACVVM
ncbi:subunit CCDC53 of endosome WASH complex [Nitzschia inconspicua]|uniref:Subunit CCDC53 of endosome WASH complex n=1 Tax=Nitzschia inconspicua TaxID=303405 RepID=A0A9K3Q7H5_9STRA|nr:subunit CCDC53 of endosome WASH complex [Nitzschia inconspicua]